MKITREKIHNIIFKTNTLSGRRFDIVLLWAILISVATVVFDSIPKLEPQQKIILYSLEWFFTILFTLEYIVRIWTHQKRSSYIFSFWGFIDLISFLPTYLSLFIPGYHYLAIIRIIRLLRVFKVMKMMRFYREALSLAKALRISFYKVSVFLFVVIVITTIVGTLMYVVEDGQNGFSSIPQCIYWAIVTVTTVGYGDVVPQTVIGKILSSLTMIMGYAIIAVPTGIITVEMSKQKDDSKRKFSDKDIYCDDCGEITFHDSNFCRNCGKKLDAIN
jgi:voltage-gated potassium channel